MPRNQCRLVEDSVYMIREQIHKKILKIFLGETQNLKNWIQWNLSKADTIGAKNLSALDRCPLYREFS